MIARILRAICLFCLTRDIQWHEVLLGPRYYDSGFHEFCAQCRVCASIYDHPEQSGPVENLEPEEMWINSDSGPLV